MDFPHVLASFDIHKLIIFFPGIKKFNAEICENPLFLSHLITNPIILNNTPEYLILMIRMKKRFKIYIAIVILLLFMPTLSYEIMKIKNGKFTVGIILTEDCDGNYSEYAEEGLYHTYGKENIKVVQIGEKLDVSGLDTREFLNSTQYSADSFLDQAYNNGLHSRHNVDAILIVTHHDISSWKDMNFNYVFGKASTKSATCIMSAKRLTASNIAEKDEKCTLALSQHTKWGISWASSIPKRNVLCSIRTLLPG